MFDSHNDDKSTGIHFQYWDKPDQNIKLSEDDGYPLATSPDGCRVIYIQSSGEGRLNLEKKGRKGISVYRMTNFCKEGK